MVRPADPARLAGRAVAVGVGSTWVYAPGAAAGAGCIGGSHSGFGSVTTVRSGHVAALDGARGAVGADRTRLPGEQVQTVWSLHSARWVAASQAIVTCCHTQPDERFRG